MTFDIHELDKLGIGTAASERAFDEYQEALIKLFYDSPEGRVLRETYPDVGFWAAQLIYYGFQYIGTSIPEMSVEDVDEIVTDLFPRKIVLMSPKDAEPALPELVAFWEYLKREHKLRNAKGILRYLKRMEPASFKASMHYRSRFGTGKSFFSRLFSRGR